MKHIVRGLVMVLVLLMLVPLVQADEVVEGRAGRAEVRFLQGMIDHHQMALDMVNDCLPKAESEELQTLCQNVIDAQSVEIEQMVGWLLAWYNIDYAPMSMMGMMDGMGGMMEQGGGHGGHGNTPPTDPAGMMGMMAGFNRLEGTAYEIAWLESMIDHHDDALHMSERLLSRVPEGTGHAELLTLAQAIIDAQTAEIALMETMISERAS
jgi:uncharacterized protein (DUF305 family)